MATVCRSFLFLISFLVVILLQKNFSVQAKTTRFIVTPDILPHLVLGYKDVASDLVWLRLIQEIDFKEANYVSKGLTFQMLDAITHLDPRYRVAYSAGGT